MCALYTAYIRSEYGLWRCDDITEHSLQCVRLNVKHLIWNQSFEWTSEIEKEHSLAHVSKVASEARERVEGESRKPENVNSVKNVLIFIKPVKKCWTLYCVAIFRPANAVGCWFDGCIKMFDMNQMAVVAPHRPIS